MPKHLKKMKVFAGYGLPGTPKMRPRWAQVGRRWPQDGPRWPKMAPRSPKMAPRCAQVALRCPSCPEDGSQHRADTAIFPFFAHVPSENAVFHKPVLAWEREARLRLGVSKHEAVSPRRPKVSQDVPKMGARGLKMGRCD